MINNIWYGARLGVITRPRYVNNSCNGTHKLRFSFFLNSATSRGISGQTHGVDIKSLNRCIVLKK